MLYALMQRYNVTLDNERHTDYACVHRHPYGLSKYTQILTVCLIDDNPEYYTRTKYSLWPYLEKN